MKFLTTVIHAATRYGLVCHVQAVELHAAEFHPRDRDRFTPIVNQKLASIHRRGFVFDLKTSDAHRQYLRAVGMSRKNIWSLQILLLYTAAGDAANK
jgi:hypothetical protein